MAKTSQLGQTGRIGESLAIRHLKEQNYKVLDTNVTYKFGEIDIVAQREKVIHFIEVKAADSNSRMMVSLSERIGHSKQLRIKKSVQQYVVENNLYEHELQIDAILIKVDTSQKAATIKYIANIT